jgi:cyclophilin family peptidyl-prolyl cis-trans isomerase
VEGRGNIFIRLHPKEAPKTVRHILILTKQGFYNRQRFHKVVKQPKPFLVQIGDPTSKSGDIGAAGGAGTGARIPYEETGFKNALGAVGLIRNLDDMNSGDCQFYMLLDKSSFLDGNYTVFGQVVVGLDVLKKIQLGDRLTAAEVLQGEPLRSTIKPTASRLGHSSGTLRLVD